MTSDSYRSGSAEVTYVVPSMGRDTLPIALQSALNQTVPTRVIAVDSRGTGLAIPAELRESVTVINGGRPLRPGAARQLGLQVAETPYVGFLDDDDVLVPAKTATQLELCDQQNLDLATCNFFYLSYEQTIALPSLDGLLSTPSGLATQPPRPPRPGEADIRKYLFHRQTLRARKRIVTSSILVRRSMGHRVRWSADQSRYEDWAWLVGLANLGARWGHHPAAMVGITLAAPASISANKRAPSAADYDWAAEALAGDRRALGDFLSCDVALACLKAGAFDLARSVYRQAVASAAPGPMARLRFGLEYGTKVVTRKITRIR